MPRRVSVTKGSVRLCSSRAARVAARRSQAYALRPAERGENTKWPGMIVRSVAHPQDFMTSVYLRTCLSKAPYHPQTTTNGAPPRTPPSGRSTRNLPSPMVARSVVARARDARMNIRQGGRARILRARPPPYLLARYSVKRLFLTGGGDRWKGSGGFRPRTDRRLESDCYR